MLSTSGGQSTPFAVLVHGVADPVNSGIVADADMLGVHKDNLKILVGGICVNPVGVQNSEVASDTADSLLCNAAQVSGELKLVDTLVFRLTVHNTSVVRTLTTSSTDSNSEDRETLKGNKSRQ